jgi:hypothetical protein
MSVYTRVLSVLCLCVYKCMHKCVNIGLERQTSDFLNGYVKLLAKIAL